MSTPDPTQPPTVTPPAAPIVMNGPPPGAAPAPAAVAPIVPAEPFDEARALATIAAQRASETALKAQLAEAKKAQDELAAIKAAQLTDQEKQAAELERLRAVAADGATALREARLLAALAKPDVGLVDATAAAALITGVVYDETGTPTNLDERIAALKTERPFLLATPLTPVVPPVPGINPGGGHQPGPAPTLTVEEAQQAQQAGMDPAHFAALKEIGTASNQLEAWQALRAQRKAPPA